MDTLWRRSAVDFVGEDLFVESEFDGMIEAREELA